MYGVYIVDDERLVIKDLMDDIPWLENGFEVVGFNTSPKRAIDEIIKLKPDVVFCDLRMPGPNDGIDLIRLIKESGTDTEFIMLSAFAEFEASRDFFTMGGIDYLIKPLEYDNATLVLEKASRIITGKHRKTPSVKFVPSQTESFDNLVAYVVENFNKKITLIDLSHKFNISQTYICDLFAKHYNSTLKMFITNLRMKEAERLILETSAPIKEISNFCGYQNYNYFCKVFKEHFFKSPTEFREEKG